MSCWILILQAHWKNSPRIDMSLYADTLYWFRAKESLLFLLNAACSTEKQHIPILSSLVWPDRGSNPRSTAFEASTLTITPHTMRSQRTQIRLSLPNIIPNSILYFNSIWTKVITCNTYNFTGLGGSASSSSNSNANANAGGGGSFFGGNLTTVKQTCLYSAVTCVNRSLFSCPIIEHFIWIESF